MMSSVWLSSKRTLLPKQISLKVKTNICDIVTWSSLMGTSQLCLIDCNSPGCGIV